MKYSYYPGCTLRTKAKDLDAYARASAKALGFELEEIENWQCCGGVYPLGSDEIATKLSSVRALNEAKEKGQDLVTLCSACHHVIKRVNDDMRNVEDIRTRANNYMQLDEPYAENPQIIEDFIRAIGAEPVVYPYRNECCGGYISLKEKEMSGRMSCNIVDSAAGAGAEMLITACPLCMYNLNKSGSGKIPVYYFTELLAEALGVKEEALK